jgi:hypothetical protein
MRVLKQFAAMGWLSLLWLQVQQVRPNLLWLWSLLERNEVWLRLQTKILQIGANPE